MKGSLIKLASLLMGICLISPATVEAQVVTTGQPVTLHALVGPRIDKAEYIRFRIDDQYRVNKFEYAEIFVRDADSYLMNMHLNNGQVSTIMLSTNQFNHLQNTVADAGQQILSGLEEAMVQTEEGTSPLIRLEMEDGTILQGTVNALAEDKVFMQTSFGEASPKLEDIYAVKVSGTDFQPSSQYGFANPNATRYLFAPSAIPLKKGEGYYQNVWVTLNSINYGISNNLSIAGGIEMISTFSTIFADTDVGAGMFVNLKYGAPVGKKLHLGGGILFAGAVGSYLDEANMGVAYGLATLGDHEHNATLAVGWGMVSGELASRPTITFSAMTRLNRRLALVTENWWISSRNEYTFYDDYDWQTGRPIGPMYTGIEHDNIVALSGALRVMTEKITFDLGIVTAGNIHTSKSDHPTRRNNSYTEWIPIPLPYLDFVYKF